MKSYEAKKECFSSKTGLNEQNVDEVIVKLWLTNLYTWLKVRDSDSKMPVLVVDIFYYHSSVTAYCKPFLSS